MSDNARYTPAHLAERIREARTMAGFKRKEDFAAAMSTSTTLVKYWERGHSAPLTPNLCRLAQTVGVSVDWLLGGEPGRVENLKADRLGANIKRVRQERGLSMQGLGDLLGRTRQGVEQYEQATSMSAMVLCRLAAALACKPSELLYGGDTETNDLCRLAWRWMFMAPEADGLTVREAKEQFAGRHGRFPARHEMDAWLRSMGYSNGGSDG